MQESEIMANPLDGARLKVVRAQEHVDALKGEIGSYLDTWPYEFVPNPKFDSLNLSIKDAPLFRITTAPPLHCSLIIGDCVTNLRAALDYILWELTARYFNPPFDVTDLSDRRITSFPIYEKPGDAGYTDRLKRLTKRGLPTPAIDLIDLVQPHNGGYKPLWWLHELVNTDKHRVPLLVVGSIPAYAWVADENGIIPPVVTPSALAFYEALQAKRLPTDPVAMRMYPQVTVQVSFEDFAMPREPVDRTLEDIVKTVADIIPRFQSFFT